MRRGARTPMVRDMDPKRIVEEGFDRIAGRHAEWARGTRTEERTRYLSILLDMLPLGARVLELGCGGGGRVTNELASRFDLTGVDISGRSIELVRRSTPGAKFIHGDMTQIAFSPESFDGVGAFYSIIHVPRNEQGILLEHITTWLRPGGIFVGTLGAFDTEAAFEDDWLGTPMYWSSYDAVMGRALVQRAGLRIMRAAIETADEDGEPTSFFWVVARRPEGPGCMGET